MVQWLRLRAPDAERRGLIRGQGTRAHKLRLKSLHATTKDFTPHKEDCRARVPQLRLGAAKIKKQRNVGLGNHLTSCFTSNFLPFKKNLLKQYIPYDPAIALGHLSRECTFTQKNYTQMFIEALSVIVKNWGKTQKLFSGQVTKQN